MWAQGTEYSPDGSHLGKHCASHFLYPFPARWTRATDGLELRKRTPQGAPFPHPFIRSRAFLGAPDNILGIFAGNGPVPYALFRHASKKWASGISNNKIQVIGYGAKHTVAVQTFASILLVLHSKAIPALSGFSIT